jgi:hypothetical protein
VKHLNFVTYYEAFAYSQKAVALKRAAWRAHVLHARATATVSVLCCCSFFVHDVFFFREQRNYKTMMMMIMREILQQYVNYIINA